MRDGWISYGVKEETPKGGIGGPFGEWNLARPAVLG